MVLYVALVSSTSPSAVVVVVLLFTSLLYGLGLRKLANCRCQLRMARELQIIESQGNLSEDLFTR